MNTRSFSFAGLTMVLSMLIAPLHAEGNAEAGKNKTAMCAGQDMADLAAYYSGK